MEKKLTLLFFQKNHLSGSNIVTNVASVKLYQTLQRELKKLVKKNSAMPRFFNPLLSVWISDETLFLAFDILLELSKRFWISLGNPKCHLVASSSVFCIQRSAKVCVQSADLDTLSVIFTSLDIA